MAGDLRLCQGINGRAKPGLTIGDVRSGSVKHLAASVGVRAQVLAALRGFLAAQAASF
jgi:hypothetical protein